MLVRPRDGSRPQVRKATTLEGKLAFGATSSTGTPIYPSEGGQDGWLWQAHLSKIKGRRVVYADFGSNDFLHTSNTFFLDACTDARGICVEASAKYAPDYAKRFAGADTSPDESRRRRGRDVDGSPWRQVAATLRPGRG